MYNNLIKYQPLKFPIMEILVAFLYYDTMFLRYDDNRLSLILIGKERVYKK